ncbi:MAG: type II secretion system protein [Candidatus Microsaccharimonas sp.]
MSTGRRGFTIVELLIVIVVIAVLAAILVVGYGAVQNNAHDASVKSDLQNIDDAFKQYALDNEGVFPDTAAELTTLGLKLNQNSYYTANKANLYVCVNATSTEYAVVAMSLSGNRFMVKSESGISDYTASVTWNATTANWSTTCTGADASYVPGSGNLTGMQYTSWLAWTGEPSITNFLENPSVTSNITGWVSSNTSDLPISRVQVSGQWVISGTRNNTNAAAFRTTDMPITVVNGNTYTVSATVTTSVAQNIRIDVRRNLTSTAIFSQTVMVSANTPTRISTTGVVDSSQINIGFYLATGNSGSVITIDNTMFTEGSTVYDYADGSTQGWAWNGTANNSSSIGPPL